MNPVTILRLVQFTADFPALTGVSRARQLLAKLIEWSAGASPKGTLIIDFTDVGNASASFLRESILAFRDYARAYQPELFPVLANVTDDVREEFNTLDVTPSTPDAFAALIRREIPKWRKVVQDAKISME